MKINLLVKNVNIQCITIKYKNYANSSVLYAKLLTSKMESVQNVIGDMS